MAGNEHSQLEDRTWCSSWLVPTEAHGRTSALVARVSGSQQAALPVISLMRPSGEAEMAGTCQGPTVACRYAATHHESGQTIRPHGQVPVHLLLPVSVRCDASVPGKSMAMKKLTSITRSMETPHKMWIQIGREVMAAMDPDHAFSAGDHCNVDRTTHALV